MLDTSNGYCKIHAFRNGVCSTFFCEEDYEDLAQLQQEGLVLCSPVFCTCRGDLVHRAKFDCFGQAAGSGHDSIICPHCGSKTAATRFAPHLQRCMGGGRTGSTRQSRSSTPSQQHSGEDSTRGSGDSGGRTSRGQDDSRSANQAPTPATQRVVLRLPVLSSFSAGRAAVKLEKRLQERPASRGSHKRPRTSVATAKHAPYLAIANAAVRSGQSAATKKKKP